MSHTYGEGTAGAGSSGPHEPSGTVETAKHEATQVKDTAMGEAGHVAETAKTEAAAVAQEAKVQIKDLYAQTRTELRDQASAQQRRVAEGLRSVGDELGAMASNSDAHGMGADLVRQASTKVDAVAGWLSERDPEGMLREVKSYARRKPGMFIAAAAIAGLAVGRLTRALSESAAEHSGSSTNTSAGAATTGASSATTTPGSASVPPPITPPVTPPPVSPVSGTPATPPTPPSPGMSAPGSPVTTPGVYESGATDFPGPPAGAPAAPDGVAGGVSTTGVPTSSGIEDDTPVFDETDANRDRPYGEERP